MQAMVDEPNDMWAAAMVIYQTIVSADAKGLKDHGDWMFGPTGLQYEQIVQLPSKQEQDNAVRNAIQQEQQLWVRRQMLVLLLLSPVLICVAAEASQSHSLVLLTKG